MSRKTIRLICQLAFLKNKKRPRHLYLQAFKSIEKAGDERIELPPKVLETPIIPFDQSPTLFTLYIQNFIQIIRLSKFFKSNILAYSYATSKDSRSTTLRFVSLDLLRKSLSESPIIFADKSARCFPIHPSFFSAFSRLSPRPISNSQLHVLPHFHLCPIYLVVFKGSYSRRRDISS